MKYSELYRIIVQNGWTKLENRGKGSHVRYEKNGKIYTVPFHKGKEVAYRTSRKILKDLDIEI